MIDLYKIPLTTDFTGPVLSIEPEKLQQFVQDVVKMKTLTPILYQIISQTLTRL